MMPFASAFDEVYAELKSALKVVGFSCVRADDIYANRPIMTTIVYETLTSHFVIADLTDKNPNVFYEVGISHALRDLSSVILISQGMEFVPFDLRHLPVILYESDNLRGLTSRVVKRILENKDIFTGQARLRERYEHQFANGQAVEEVIEYLEGRERSFWKVILLTLDPSEESLEESDVVSSTFQLRAELAGLTLSGHLRLFRSLFKIYKDILVRFLDTPKIDEYVSDILRYTRFSDFSIDETEMNSLIIELAAELYKHPRFKRRAIEWMFSYLARPKTAGIDLNRAKVEHFMMYADDPEIRDALVYSLEHENAYLREIAADFIGELRLQGAIRNLVFALARETGPYVARSIFSALGKIGTIDGAAPIISWIRSHVQEIQQRDWDFVVRHAERAIGRIDHQNGTSYAAELAPLLAEIKSS
jgi:hypothetical protein